MPESVGSSGRVVLTPKPASITISASAPTLEVKFSAEHWQFFAFVFGACLTRGFSLLDEIPGESPRLGRQALAESPVAIDHDQDLVMTVGAAFIPRARILRRAG